jgi:hypothetical protein
MEIFAKGMELMDRAKAKGVTWEEGMTIEELEKELNGEKRNKSIAITNPEPKPIPKYSGGDAGKSWVEVQMATM